LIALTVQRTFWISPPPALMLAARSCAAEGRFHQRIDMTYSSADMQADVEEALQRAGYSIVEDDSNDDDGWIFLDPEGVRGSAATFESAAAASAAAVAHLVQRLESARKLALAAANVIERWESRDLAEAVRELQASMPA
jgi:hypothetical protein